MNNKVIFVISALGGGGAERVLLSLANEMSLRGTEVRILKTGWKSGAYALRPEITLIQVPKYTCSAPLKALRMLTFMRGVFREHADYTVISFLSDNNMLSILASLGLPNRVIVCERNDPSRNCTNALLRRVRNLIYRLADGSVFQTEDMRDYFAPSIRRKGTVIPNPVLIDDGVYATVAAGAVPQKRVLAAGRLTPQKNYPMLIRAFAIVHRSCPDYNLEIYGSGELESELRGEISEAGLDQVITIHPFSDDIYRLMKESTVYVSSSDYEGISNTMLEAMALGVPTVVTDCPIGGARLMVRNEENGLLVPVGDEEAMAAALIRLLKDEGLRERLSAASVRIRQDYGIEKITDQWMEIL